MRIPARFHHGLMRLSNGIDVLVQALADHLRLACFYRIAGETQENFRYRNTGLCTIDGVGDSIQLVSFFLETFEPLIVLALEGCYADGTRAYSNYNQH
jgi:hypothetical protein